MPLSFAVIGENNVIKRILGKAEIKKHLANLGFVVGGNVSVVSENQGNMIVSVKGSRVAISSEMANKIFI